MLNIEKLPHTITGKVLLQLSGGKDSIACLLLLHKWGVELEVIHFVHKYSYELPTEQCKNVCKQLGIGLNIIDISEELTDVLTGEFEGRPCRKCKAIMDSRALEYATSHGCRYLCIGDTADDTMLVNRLKINDGEVSFFSRYLNASVEIPSGISVIRPLIFEHEDSILDFVNESVPNYKRVNDTGDKYYEYSREGCPLQFKDLGAKFTPELMMKLKRYNSECSKFATQNGIRASIHLPSENIITIPKGHEDSCRSFLISNGCELKDVIKDGHSVFHYSIIVQQQGLDNSNGILKYAISRFCERLGIKEYEINASGSIISATSSRTSIIFIDGKILNVVIISDTKADVQKLENICIELFHTDKISITENTVLQ